MRGTGRPHVIAAIARASAVACLGGLVLSSMLAASPALGALHTAHCRKLTRQIDRYQGVAEMAADRGDKLWLASTLNRVERLSTRRVGLCPEYAEPNYVAIYAKWAADILKKAGRAFITFLTFGAF